MTDCFDEIVVTLNLFQGLRIEMLKRVQHDDSFDEVSVTLNLFAGSAS